MRGSRVELMFFIYHLILSVVDSVPQEPVPGTETLANESSKEQVNAINDPNGTKSYGVVATPSSIVIPNDTAGSLTTAKSVPEVVQSATGPSQTSNKSISILKLPKNVTQAVAVPKLSAPLSTLLPIASSINQVASSTISSLLSTVSSKISSSIPSSANPTTEAAQVPISAVGAGSPDTASKVPVILPTVTGSVPLSSPQSVPLLLTTKVPIEYATDSKGTPEEKSVIDQLTKKPLEESKMLNDKMADELQSKVSGSTTTAVVNKEKLVPLKQMYNKKPDVEDNALSIGNVMSKKGIEPNKSEVTPKPAVIDGTLDTESNDDLLSIEKSQGPKLMPSENDSNGEAIGTPLVGTKIESSPSLEEDTIKETPIPQQGGTTAMPAKNVAQGTEALTRESIINMLSKNALQGDKKDDTLTMESIISTLSKQALGEKQENSLSSNVFQEKAAKPAAADEKEESTSIKEEELVSKDKLKINGVTSAPERIYETATYIADAVNKPSEELAIVESKDGKEAVLVKDLKTIITNEVKKLLPEPSQEESPDIESGHGETIGSDLDESDVDQSEPPLLPNMEASFLKQFVDEEIKQMLPPSPKIGAASPQANRWLNFTRIQDGNGGGDKILTLVKSVQNLSNVGAKAEALLKILEGIKGRDDLKAASNQGLEIPHLLELLSKAEDQIESVSISYDSASNQLNVDILEKAPTSSTSPPTTTTITTTLLKTSSDVIDLVKALEASPGLKSELPLEPVQAAKGGEEGRMVTFLPDDAAPSDKVTSATTHAPAAKDASVNALDKLLNLHPVTSQSEEKEDKMGTDTKDLPNMTINVRPALSGDMP